MLPNFQRVPTVSDPTCGFTPCSHALPPSIYIFIYLFFWARNAKKKIDPQKTLGQITNFRPTLKTDEFVKLENEYKNAQKGLEEATPKAATDPVGFAVALGKLTKVISKFARLDFLRKDIITD